MDKRYTKLLRALNENKDGHHVPHDDGPHYSAHKESVERAKNVARGMGFKESVLPSSITPPLAPKEDRDRADRVRDHELAKRHHERQMTRDPENKKYHLQQASLHSAAEDAGAEVSRIAPGKLRDAANRDFEIKSKKALGESVEVNEAHTMVCKDCGDELNKPTTDCKNDCSDPNGSHWVKEYMNETSDAAAASWADSRKKLNKGLKQAVKTRDLALQIDKKIAQSRKVRNEEMSDEVKARVASLRNTPSQIAARKAAAKNKMVRPGTEADLPKDHDWNDRDAYPKESTEVDELAQMVPNRNFVKPKDKEKMDQLSKDLDKLRGNLNRGPNDVITEEELEEAGWTPMMRRAAARRMKILAPRIKLGIKRSKNRTATKEKLMNRAVKSVKAALIKKFTRGQRKVDLTPARRAEMEKRLKRLGPRIKQLALKQVPATRKMERDRKKNKAK